MPSLAEKGQWSSNTSNGSLTSESDREHDNEPEMHLGPLVGDRYGASPVPVPTPLPGSSSGTATVPRLMSTPATTLAARRFTDNLFFPRGFEDVDPPLIHYLHVGLWFTRTIDYYRQRRPGPHDDTAGQLLHWPIWLHRAKPRDQFVFLVQPVRGGMPELTFTERVMKFFYGVAPRFAIKKRTKIARQQGRRRGRNGVEAIEVKHSNITAMDYGPSLQSDRLAIETRLATSRWFPSRAAAEAHYEIGMVDQPSSPGSGLMGRTDTSGMMPPLEMGRSMTEGSIATPTAEPAPPKAGSSTGPTTNAGKAPPAAGHDSGTDTPPPAPLSSTLPTSTSVRSQDSERFVDAHRASVDAAYDMIMPGRLSPSSGPASPNAADESSSSDDNEHRRAATPRQQVSFEAAIASPAGNDSGRLDPDQLERRIPDTMIVLYSQDPVTTSILRETLQPTCTAHRHRLPGATTQRFVPFTESEESQKRLLALCEAGIPTWAIFCCRYGLPYRRSFRIVAVTMLNIWPFIALIVGLYDLYKHMPYVRTWLEPFAEWMENHFTLRMSVAVAYAFTVVIQALDSIVKFVKSIGAVVGFVVSPLYPLWQLVLLLYQPVAALLRMIWTLGTPLLLMIQGLWNGIATTFMLPWYMTKLVMGLMSAKRAVEPVAAGVKNVSTMLIMWQRSMRFWQEVARPVKNLLKAIYDGIVHVGVNISKRDASLRQWYRVKYNAVAVVANDVVHKVQDEYHEPSWRSIVFFALLAVVVAACVTLGVFSPTLAAEA